MKGRRGGTKLNIPGLSRPMLAALAWVSLVGAAAQTPPSKSAVTDLGGTSWQLVKVQGGDDKTLTPDDRSKYTIAFGTDGRVSMRVDCNRGSGTWKSAQSNQLEFGPLALTRAMCPPGSLHDRIVKDLQFVRSYVVKGGHLYLSLMADGGIYEFEPIAASEPRASKGWVASTGPVKYACTRAGGGKDALMATFFQTVPPMVLVERGTRTLPAFLVPAGSGAKYEGPNLIFWEKAGEAQVTWMGTELQCTSQ